MVKLQVLKIQSFYGAIACFILLQLFGFILFNAFTFYIESLFTIFWGFMWVSVWIYYEAKTIYNIKMFMKSEKDFNLNLKEISKLILALIFLILLIIFNFYWYPFPEKEFNFWYLALFYLASWTIAAFFSKEIKHDKITPINYKKFINYIIIFIGLFFFISWILNPELFYFIGIVGFVAMFQYINVWLL